jgi:hypothetical protein
MRAMPAQKSSTVLLVLYNMVSTSKWAAVSLRCYELIPLHYAGLWKRFKLHTTKMYFVWKKIAGVHCLTESSVYLDRPHAVTRLDPALFSNKSTKVNFKLV